MFDCINQAKKKLNYWRELTNVVLELYTIILGNVGNHLLKKNCTRQIEEKGIEIWSIKQKENYTDSAV